MPIEFKEFSKITRHGKCKNCGIEFVITNNKKVFCSAKCREKMWVEANREQLNANVRNYRARRYQKEGQWRDEGPKAKELKRWMIELKSKPCYDCNNSFPTCCMDFDHRKGTKKEYDVGSMFAHHYSRELIEIELLKCDLVCANCHRIRTQKRKIGSGKSVVT